MNNDPLTCGYDIRKSLLQPDIGYDEEDDLLCDKGQEIMFRLFTYLLKQ